MHFANPTAVFAAIHTIRVSLTGKGSAEPPEFLKFDFVNFLSATHKRASYLSPEKNGLVAVLVNFFSPAIESLEIVPRTGEVLQVPTFGQIGLKMSEKNAKESCMFVNLAEKLAVQNQVIIQTMDEIIERATMNAADIREKYEAQVQKTVDATIISDLAIGCNREEVPRPKSLNRQQSTVQEDSLT